MMLLLPLAIRLIQAPYAITVAEIRNIRYCQPREERWLLFTLWRPYYCYAADTLPLRYYADVTRDSWRYAGLEAAELGYATLPATRN